MNHAMKRFTSRLTILLTLTSIAGVAAARPDIPWDGRYFGGNLGEASSSSCNGWALTSAAFDSATAAEFNNRTCSTDSAFVGGVQFGENVQHNRLVLGIAVDLDFWSAGNLTQSQIFLGRTPPAGTYVFSSKRNPSGFAVVGPRMGYGGNIWQPYVKAGGVIDFGARNSTLAYIPAGSAISTASFEGGKDFSTFGWAAGCGFELALKGAWSITAEYLHVSLGKGSDSTTTCIGTAASCAAFSGISFENTHEGFSANIIRMGVTYWFGYW
jgi:opacity protein-like surface antigen